MSRGLSECDALAREFAQAAGALDRAVPRDRLRARIDTAYRVAKSHGWSDYRDQTLDSVTCLWLLAAWQRPEVIIEVGTGFGCSLSTWLIYGEAEVHAIDVGFGGWRRLQAADPLPTPGLTLHQMRSGEVEFERLIRGRRTLFWLDAHDGDQEEIFAPVMLGRVFPVLRRSPHLFAMHDISLCAADYAQTSPDHPGPCRTPDGRSWAGFPEVVPLTAWASATDTVLQKPDAILRDHGMTMGETSVVFFRVP